MDQNQQPQAPNQTSGTGVPLQVENVQYNVQVGKVRSKIGTATLFMTIFAWLAVFTLLAFFLTIWNKVAGDTNVDVGGALVFSISVLIPILPILWYAHHRVSKLIQENSSFLEDLFFKKTIRFSLIISTIIAVFWTIAFIFNVLSKIFLNKPVTLVAIGDSFIYLVLFLLLGLFFLRYQLMTKR